MSLESLAGPSSAALSGPALAALGAAGGAAITALYFVRLRRRRARVAFAQLWLGTADEARAMARARRLRHWLSLALALAIYAALLVGAANHRPSAVDRQGRSLVVLIDRSASMSARDEPGTRLGAARERAVEIVRGLGPADRALVASFAADATAESGFEADGDRLARAALAVAPSDEAGDLPRALAFAAAVLRGRPRPTAIVVSDGGFPPEQRLAPPAGWDLRYLPVGRRGDNVGILSLAARRIPADPGAVDTVLVVQSHRAARAPVRLEIASGGTAIETLSLDLGPGESRRVRLGDLFAAGARIEAQLVGSDDLPGDDRAEALVPPLPVRRVLRVGGPDLYLDGALLGLGRTIRVDRLSASEADRALAAAAGYDLVIFDAVTPADPPAAGRFLYFDPRGPGSPFEVRGTVRAPVLDPASVRRDHPLVRGLDLSDVNLAEARRLLLGPGDLALAGSFGPPLVVARERPGLRVAALAFDPRRSDLPLRPAFPLLISNALAWAAGASTGADDTPAAERGTQRSVAEVDTTPIPKLVLGGQALAPPDPPRPQRGGSSGTLGLGLAAALLIFEWVSYHRRWTT